MSTIPAIADRVREITNSTGTGTITLAGAALGFSSFATAFPGTSTQVYYCIADALHGTWEVGTGTFTLSSNTLSRDTIASSSSAGSLVSFVAGQKDVFVTMPSSVMEALNSFSYGTTPPTGATPGDTWLDTSDCTLYTYINDGTSSQWVDLMGSSLVTSSSDVPTYITDTQPTDQGQYLWIQTGLGSDGTDVTFWINI